MGRHEAEAKNRFYSPPRRCTLKVTTNFDPQTAMNAFVPPPHRLLQSLLVCAVLTLAGAPAAGQESPNPERPLVRAAQLQEKANDLKAQGRHEEAMRLQREADELRARGPMRPAGEELENRLRELRERREQLLKQLDELRRSERNDEAAKTKEEVVGVEREIAELKRQLAEMRKGPMREPERFGPEGDQRLQHLRVAIDNLRAAGLTKQAERLEKEAESLRRQVAAQRGRGDEDLRREMRKLREEIDRLREQLRNLERRIEQNRAPQEKR